MEEPDAARAIGILASNRDPNISTWFPMGHVILVRTHHYVRIEIPLNRHPETAR
jgi:hypothetical protein